MGGGLLASVASTVGSGSNESFAIRRGRTRRAGTTGEVDRGRSATSYKVAARFFLRNCTRSVALNCHSFAGTPLRWSRRCVRFPLLCFRSRIISSDNSDLRFATASASTMMSVMGQLA